MSHSSSLIVLGLLIILAPFSGLPYSVLDFFLPVFGLLVFAIGFSMRTKHVKDLQGEKQESIPAPSQAPTFETTSNIG